MRAAEPDAVETLGDENAVVLVKLHDVCHGAERDEVDQRIESGLGLLRVDAALAKKRPEG